MGAQTDSNFKTVADSGGGQGGHMDFGAKTGQVSNRVTAAAPEERNSRKLVGRWLGIGIVASAAMLGLTVLYKTTHHPRTDDATVLANYIGIAPQVEGPLVRLPIQDNQLVRKGELLFEIDDRAKSSWRRRGTEILYWSEGDPTTRSSIPIRRNHTKMKTCLD